ncbi:CubicO group peptidase (beta-lactamase class C family) [Breznakibacter xylanolyticus]|uniref:CubicO group peptidase (Beta-lactamase class C family) n=1 Tax=Breznakibacter xylanolyticus TaxID=990 RepID=A0A2W7MWS8_9BACT|nr:serine hydrolase [Breznakibacter xylanolyticus]PZX12240.1 CubicO group peptidase (beta-lactamase class C family) [Breznakibacter xylanolyticus]
MNKYQLDDGIDFNLSLMMGVNKIMYYCPSDRQTRSCLHLPDINTHPPTKKTAMKRLIIIALSFLSILANAETANDILTTLPLRQKLALLFVVDGQAKDIMGLAPFGHLTSALPRPSLSTDRGLPLADASRQWIDSLPIPLPSGDSWPTLPLSDRKKLSQDFLATFPHIGALATPLTPEFPQQMGIPSGMPLPDRVLTFRTQPSATPSTQAGIIRLPANLLNTATNSANVNTSTHENGLSLISPIDPLKLGVSLDEILAMPYLIYTDNLLVDVERLLRAYENNQIDRAKADERIKWAIHLRINAPKAISPWGNTTVINHHLLHRSQLAGRSLSLVRNQQFLPLANTQLSHLHWVDLRRHKTGKINETVQFHQFNAPWLPSIPQTRLQDNAPMMVILADHQPDVPGIILKTLAFKESNPRAKVCLVLMACRLPEQYIANDFTCFDAILLGTSDHSYLWENAVQAICGGTEIRGRIPFTMNGLCMSGEGIDIIPTRMHLGHPIEAGMNAATLARIDSLMNEAIEGDAIPGGQVVVARNGLVVYRKSYGTTSYHSTEKVTPGHLYDIASVTKIMSATPLLMHLYNHNRLSLEKSIGDYLPDMKGTNKQDLKVYELLTHKAGLRANIPTFLDAIDRNAINGNLYSKVRTATHSRQIDERLYLNNQVALSMDLFREHPDTLFSIEVAKDLYMNHHFVDSTWQIIASSPLDKHKAYRYSDMGLVILQRIIETTENNKIDHLCDSLLFTPLGIQGMKYTPLRYFHESHIAPTENDRVFRKQHLRGYVHDPGAAIMGGVAGHAGLFASADEVTKMMQLFLNQGTYGDTRLFKPETVKRFTDRYNSATRRGLGFDKPETNTTKVSPVTDKASAQSFGHLGFTGTIAWADPANGLVFVFLSNRVNPNGWNRKLITTNVRNKAMTIAYEAIVTP